ncbi:MAG: Putative DNA-binding protein [uncultured Nocardioidaceae bacterium]|uniref:DNA-binding protein n=1 Tax=uncultured Nocardioidaceae bacterium TaxID=253824 RepID=A0A6J4M3T5_9ACTN|nr:MAG: Putative DNA-binding protein [uncultured Nocardioidaceae bacterium]
MAGQTDEAVAEVWEEWESAVNMTAGQLEKWLGSEDSQSVGQKSDGDDGESTGHASGRRIVQILRTPKTQLTADDAQHMHKVVGYVHRHLAQRPSGDVTDSKWRYSLMNWGHDPLED